MVVSLVIFAFNGAESLYLPGGKDLVRANHAAVVELADTLDLGSSGETRAGSSPVSRTKEVPLLGRLLKRRPEV